MLFCIHHLSDLFQKQLRPGIFLNPKLIMMQRSMIQQQERQQSFSSRAGIYDGKIAGLYGKLAINQC